MDFERCFACSEFLSKPYIKCAECSETIVELCLYCFAGGFEENEHRSDHRYEVVKDDFSLFESAWTADEELRLLDAVADCGFANWSEVADQMKYKSAEQCESHYVRCYMTNPQSPLPEMPAANQAYFPCPITYRTSTNPPRPSEDSVQQAEMSGYCCARSDFGIEHNNFAELDVKDIKFTDFDNSLETDLQFAMLRVYRTILKERHRRKLAVRQFGLIDMNRHVAEYRHYERILGVRALESLRRLSQLFTSRPVLWTMCLESLACESQLRKRIAELQQYRSSGLRWLHSGRIYDKLSRTQRQHDYHLLNDVLRYMKDSYQCQPYLQKKMVFDKLSKGMDVGRPQQIRRTAPPLDVSTLPGCERLTPTEKQLCSRVRLLPEAYIDFKRILLTEHNKHGYLRLAQARTLIKIDVNKTRKIYDFLIGEGLIKTEKDTA